MNERIRELALESKLLIERKPHPSKGMEELSQRVAKAVDAQLAHYYEVTGGKPESQEVLVQKFAELIVRECALTLESITVVVSESYEDFDNGYNKGLLAGSTVIKQRFGVEK